MHSLLSEGMFGLRNDALLYSVDVLNNDCKPMNERQVRNNIIHFFLQFKIQTIIIKPVISTAAPYIHQSKPVNYLYIRYIINNDIYCPVCAFGNPDKGFVVFFTHCHFFSLIKVVIKPNIQLSTPNRLCGSTRSMKDKLFS